MSDRFISILEQAEARAKQEEFEAKQSDEAASMDLLGHLHHSYNNAANPKSAEPEFVLDFSAGAMAAAAIAGITIAGPVESHQPREKTFDDTEAKVVQGRLWLISFTDLFSLMLCFFLMLYSMKDPDSTHAPQKEGSHADNMHGGIGAGEAGVQQGQNIARVGYGDGLNLDYLQGIIKDALVQVHLEKDVRIAPGSNHIKLMMDSEQVFNGEALSADGQRIAKGLANRLATLSNRITVVGQPSSSGNWAVSLAQASAFAGLMRDAGYRKPFVVVGEGAGNNPGIEIRVEADDGNMR